MLENTFMNVKNRSSKITADLDIPAGGANGAITSLTLPVRFEIQAKDTLFGPRPPWSTCLQRRSPRTPAAVPVA